MGVNSTDRDQCRRQEEREARQREDARAVARVLTEDPDEQRVIAFLLLLGGAID